MSMEYCLSGDDGAATIWHRGPDLDVNGDGRLDAVGLDFDHDGRVDDALADLDGDGLGDHIILDVGDPGQRYYSDDGTGTWAIAEDPPSRTAAGLRWFGLDGVEHTGTPPTGFDPQSGEVRLVDSDGNGLADRALITGADGVIGYVDTDGDGRWDVKLTDTDGDGTADAASALTPER